MGVQPGLTGAATAPAGPLTDAELSRIRLLSDPGRVRILEAIRDTEDGSANVTQICAALGEPQPKVSHHLALLKAAAILEWSRVGRTIRYRARAEVVGEVAGAVAGLCRAGG